MTICASVWRVPAPSCRHSRSAVTASFRSGWEDFEDAIPNHRHTSHLISLYPEHQISPRTTPELAHAAEITIQRRINAPHWEQSEWGRANLIVY